MFRAAEAVVEFGKNKLLASRASDIFFLLVLHQINWPAGPVTLKFYWPAGLVTSKFYWPAGLGTDILLARAWQRG